MFINFSSEDFQTEKVLFEIFLGNQPIQRQQVNAPRAMLEAMFLNYVQELAARNEPMHLKMSGEVEIWDEFENCRKILPKSIDYWNYNYEGEE